MLFVHSKCCNTHWYINNGVLRCKNCGTEAGGITVESEDNDELSHCCNSSFELTYDENENIYKLFCDECDAYKKEYLVVGPNIKGCDNCNE